MLFKKFIIKCLSEYDLAHHPKTMKLIFHYIYYLVTQTAHFKDFKEFVTTRLQTENHFSWRYVLFCTDSFMTKRKKVNKEHERGNN